MVAILAAALSSAAAGRGTTLYVSPTGSDAWSGTLEAPNAERSDGPLASIATARDAIRRLKARSGGLTEPIRVLIRGGTYYLSETIAFGPEDSGTSEAPISYEAYPGERPVLCGGKKITGWEPYRGEIQSVSLAGVRQGKWEFRSLFANGRRQIRARAPNFDRSDPYRKGFFYAARDPEGFGLAVGNIHNPGDWMEYKVRIPADGAYDFWIYYGADNRAWGTEDMGGHTILTVDRGRTIPLMNLPNTGSWGTFRWSRSASVPLTQGEHTLKWQNQKGGGLNLAAYALTDDPDWKPVSTKLPKAAAGKHVVVIQAANFTRFEGKQLSVSGSSAGSATEFHYAPGDFKASWAQAPGAEVHIFQSSSCRAFKEIVSLRGINEKTRTVTVGGSECVTPLVAGDRYFVENVMEELDSPGEWYLDRRVGRLFYWPEVPLTAEAEIVAPVLGRLVQVVGDPAGKKPVSHLRFVGLTLEDTDYSPGDGCAGYGMGNDGTIYLGAATGCTIEGCTLRNIGKYAVCVAGGRGNMIRGCDISEGAEGGILLLKSAGNTVLDNHIHHCGAVYKHIGGVILEGPGTDENRVAHNMIHDISRYGISLKNPGSRNVVEYNRILNTNLETFDTGGIEVTQHDKEFRSGSTIRHNVVGDTVGYSSEGPKPVFLSWSIYLDSYAGGYTVTGNVCYRSAHGGIMLQGGKDNRVENNIFVDGRYGQGHLSNFDNNSTGQVLRSNIFAYSDPKAVLFFIGSLSPKVIAADYNLYFHSGGGKLTIPGVGSFADWQKRGFDRDSLVADPLFVDAEHDDYALRPESPALKLGFQPIDTSKIGLVTPRCRCTIRPACREFFIDRSPQ
jgi:parallel beta-helix repeat protein